MSGGTEHPTPCRAALSIPEQHQLREGRCAMRKKRVGRGMWWQGPQCPQQPLQPRGNQGWVPWVLCSESSVSKEVSLEAT